MKRTTVSGKGGRGGGNTAVSSGSAVIILAVENGSDVNVHVNGSRSRGHRPLHGANKLPRHCGLSGWNANCTQSKGHRACITGLAMGQFEGLREVWNVRLIRGEIGSRSRF